MKQLSKFALKRQNICQNCNYIYYIIFKDFTENFCSLDCKSSYYYVQEELCKKIDNILNLPDINFSDCSFASDLNKKTLSTKKINSLDYIYKKQYNHTNNKKTI
jgi:hypothetical protein